MKKIYFPEIKKISEVFSEAVLATGMPPYGSNWRYLSGVHAYTGGTYYKTACGIGHRNSQFTSLWVKPHPFIIEAIQPYLISPAGHMGIRENLVTLSDSCGIGVRWVAELDEGETPLSVMSSVDQKFWADEKARYEEFKNANT